MKRYLSLISLLFATALTLSSCISDGDESVILETAKPDYGQDRTDIVSSNESETFNRNGFEITVPKGAVPKTNSGSDGKVAFSVTSGGELPTALPEGTEIVNGASIKIEPMNFIFNSPITLKVPLYGQSTNEVALLRYNEYTNSWEVIPFSSVNSDGTASASVIELGYFVLIKYSQRNTFGGIHIDNRYLEEGYYYYLTLTSRSGSAIGDTKRISFAANGQDLYMANVPLGTYNVTLSRERRSNLNSQVNAIEYYPGNMTITVSTSLIQGNGGYNTYTGWTELRFEGYDWINGRPDNVWGEATTTYGTGTFQATLTWVNSSTQTYTDYDLHLYGPNNLHVYYGHKNEGAFELDRDWTNQVGNAVENLYTISDDITPGQYQIKVHHYSGASGKRYNCRVILNGVVVKSVSGATSSTDHIYTFDITE